ncbi:UNVERIFIED_ORG: hypothetical protein ABIC62_005720 [Burkholderia sp. 1595]|uniref:Methyl-accepting chemotaxis protein n=1 Tax=Paraburkholderia terricola TaxID=169427 RepID=A0ABU1LZZ4_9BURK|nr:hypothetical protein [Paraburkholderia terricola]
MRFRISIRARLMAMVIAVFLLTAVVAAVGMIELRRAA